MTTAERFMSLFAGLDRSHGTYDVPAGTQPDGKGKLNGNAITATAEKYPVEAERWLKQPLSIWAAHLAGEKSLGVVPIQADSTCVWGCLDVDMYEKEIANNISSVCFSPYQLLEKSRNELNLPLVICRSKSG